MKRTAITVFVVYAMFLISCQPAKNRQEQTTASGKELSEVKVAEKTDNTADSTATVVQTKVLSDTIGVYKISNADAKAYIVTMSELVFEIEKAMAANAPDRMPGLMKKISENQKNQFKIQSNLSKSDRALFKTYCSKIGDKLIALGDKMSKM